MFLFFINICKHCIIWFVLLQHTQQVSLMVQRTKIKYEKNIISKSKARQQPVILLVPKSPANDSKSKQLKMNDRILRHPALYSDIFIQSFFCVSKNDTKFRDKRRKHFDTILSYEKCLRLNDDGNDENGISSRSPKAPRIDNISKITMKKQNNTMAMNMHENNMVNMYASKIEVASLSSYAKAIYNYTLGRVPPKVLLRLSDNKIKKKEEKHVQGSGWYYFSSLKKIKKKMKKISLRKNHIDRWRKNELTFNEFKQYVNLGKPLFIQNLINYNDMSFQQQFYRNSFVKKFGGVALYKQKGKKVRISHIVEKMRLKQNNDEDEFCTGLKSLVENDVNNLIINTSKLKLNYSFLNISYLFNSNELFLPLRATTTNKTGNNDTNVKRTQQQLHNTMENITLSIACSLTYAPFQRHSHGKWYTLLFGRRKWILFPPQIDQSSFYEKEKLFNDYFVTEYSKSNGKDNVKDGTRGGDEPRIMNGLEGLQEQGELFYIPTGWFYAFIDIGETLALSNNVGNVLNWRLNSRTPNMINYVCELPCSIEKVDGDENDNE
jgi:hypothetical protein